MTPTDGLGAPAADAADFRRRAQQVASDVAGRAPLDERELVARWFSDGLFSCLGYGQPGEDIRLEQRVRRGRIDVVLRAFTGRPVCAIEFKRPGTDLPQYVAQLDRYIEELMPDSAALTNGVDLWLFSRRGDVLQQPPAVFTLGSISAAQAQELWDRLCRRDVDLTDWDSVRNALRDVRTNPIRVSGPDDIGGKEFLNRFSLGSNTAFGHFVMALYNALPALGRRSQFTAGAFAFWERAYARELEPGDAPRTWKELLGRIPSRAQLRQFMFALETAYAFLSRALLAKAMQDTGFPHLDVVEAYNRGVSARHAHGVLQRLDHLDVVKSVFDETGRQAFASLFASDIFDWWQDANRLADPMPLCDALAETVIAVFAFDFSALAGDLLGSLYQSYFDAETRRALGEFYTPPEVVKFILDQVGYQGHAIRTQRLLDPACGSGTFLIHALRRYFDATAAEEPRRVLDDLIGGLRIVGLDINPFATLMSQVNYAAQILPLYTRALSVNPSFKVDQLPVLRTDSLRFEKREAEEEQVQAPEARTVRRRGGQRGAALPQQAGFVLTYSGDNAYIRDRLPVRTRRGEFVRVLIAVPRYDVARRRNLVSNPEEYVFALADLFAASQSDRSDDLEQRLRQRHLERAPELATFMAPALDEIRQTLERLRAQYEDGRFLKAMADLALAVVLKNELTYDYVVGNPPYVRIQRIPELQREYWQGRYDWAQGNFDMYIPFIERAVTQWLRPGGYLGLICSNRFLVANYGEALRLHMPNDVQVRLVLDLRDTQVFRDALNYPAILVAQQRATGTTSLFAGRAFADPEGGPPALMADAARTLEAAQSSVDHALGQFTDAFPEQNENLRRGGWYLMPQAERRVFDALEAAATDKLEDLSATTSCLFQGISTGADDVMVFMALQEMGETVRVRPKGGGPEVDIERGLLRPWLFGRDVERWHVGWQGWYVLFPYLRVDDTYQLIPSRRYAENFAYAGRIPFIDERWPATWDYLTHKSVEERLRRRENGRFAVGAPEAHLWYGLAYPRSIDLYERVKILLQVSSTGPDVAADTRGRFAFTGGGTSGVNGLLPIDSSSIPFLAALLNSGPLDFYLKHVSAVYSGHAYSYGDQFLKLVPIRLPRGSWEQGIADRLMILAEELSATKPTLRDLERAAMLFPEAQAAKLGSGTNLYPISRLGEGTPSAARFDRGSIVFEPTLDGRMALRVGRTVVVLPTQVHADVVAEWLALRSTRQVNADDLMSLRLPDTEAECREVIEALREQQREAGRLQQALGDREAEVDELVFQLYGLGKDVGAKAIVAEFLQRF